MPEEEKKYKNKGIAIQEIKDTINESRLVIFSDFKGVSVTAATEFRKQLASENARMKVYKNTLARRACNESDINYPEAILIGPTAFISTTQDAAKLSKIVVTFIKENEKMTLKGGLLQNKHIDESVIKELASLPGRDVLIGKSVGLIKSPLSSLILNLSSPLRGLINVLNAIKNNKQEVKND